MLPVRKEMRVYGLLLAAVAGVGKPGTGSPVKSATVVPSLEKRIAGILPSKKDDHWKEAGWRTNLMQARAEAQEKGKPVFLWIMVGNPQGAT